VNCFDHDQTRESVAYIANELASYAAPPRSGSPPDRALAAAIAALGVEAKSNNCNFLAHSSVRSTIWNRKPELVISVLREIASAIHSAAADWLRFMIFIERPANQPSHRSRWTFSHLVPIRWRAAVETIPIGRFPANSDEPELWRRLPNLGGVRPEDCEKWGEEVARAWNCDVHLTKRWITDAVAIEDEETFAKIEAILIKKHDVLAQIWRLSRNRRAPRPQEGG
jgi:hypothetical protein